MVGFNFEPQGWALCNGQLLPISQYQALFSLLGTTYGGDGQTNFALPNLQSRVPIHMGQGQGLSPYVIGQNGGAENVSLQANQLPAHTHPFGVPCNGAAATNSVIEPKGNYLGSPNPRDPGTAPKLFSTSTDGAIMGTGTTAITGGNLPHANIQPYLTVNFIIALQGIYPPRS